jgi:hypothetical protein
MTQHNNNIIINTALQFSDLSTQTTAWTGTTTFPSIVSSSTTATSTSSQIILIADHGNKPAYYSTTASQYLYVGTDNVVYTTYANNPAAYGTLQGWFVATDFNTSNNSWTDRGPNNYSVTTGGTLTKFFDGAGNGSTTGATVVQGGSTTGDYIKWPSGSADYSSYTFVIVYRSQDWNAGANQGLMLSNSNFTWYTGFVIHTNPRFYNGSFLEPSSSLNSNWGILLCQPNYMTVNLNSGLTVSGGGGGYPSGEWGLNPPWLQNYASAGDYWNVAEIFWYSNTLNNTNISLVMNMLGQKYGITIG